MSHSEIEDLKQYIDDKFGEIKPQVTEMYEAYNTIRQGSTWLKYALWFVAAVVGLILSVRELFKH